MKLECFVGQNTNCLWVIKKCVQFGGKGVVPFVAGKIKYKKTTEKVKIAGY